MFPRRMPTPRVADGNVGNMKTFQKVVAVCSQKKVGVE